MATMPHEAKKPQRKPSIRMSVQINFDEMTWGELRRFVALADREHADDGEYVTLAWDESDYDDPNSPPIGLKFATFDSGI